MYFHMESPPALDLIYVARLSILEPERTWLLRAEEIICRDSSGERRFPLSEIAEINLQNTPNKFSSRVFRCHLFLHDGSHLQLCNQHYAGIAQFDDRSESYRDWVENLITRSASQQPALRLSGGVAAWRWWLNFVIFSLGMLAALILAVWLWMMISWLVLVKIIFIALFIPAAIRWFKVNRPRGLSAQNLPAALLP
jgi:hypothetical protein